MEMTYNFESNKYPPSGPGAVPIRDAIIAAAISSPVTLGDGISRVGGTAGSGLVSTGLETVRASHCWVNEVVIVSLWGSWGILLASSVVLARRKTSKTPFVWLLSFSNATRSLSRANNNENYWTHYLAVVER